MSEDNIWIEKFKLWKNITKKSCPAAAGPGGIFCMWIGRNCSYNDCPRRSHEEIYVRGDAGMEKEMEQLRSELNVKDEQIIILTEKLKTVVNPETEKNIEA